MSRLLLGVDGGGSKTRALLADDSGAVVGAGLAGSSNFQAVGFEQATAALQAAVAAAMSQAGLDSSTPIFAACLGLAGVDRPAERSRFEQWAVTAKLARHVQIANDAELLLAAGTPEMWGIALVCGTGSICYGRAPDGRVTRAGGWGYLLGDEGSGYDIAREALRLATQTADGRADAPVLLDAVLEHWQLDTPSDLISWTYRSEVTRSEIASLAARVVALAEAGDHSAQSILDRAAGELARLVAAVAGQLAVDRPPVALAGGLLGGTQSLWPAVRAKLGVELGTVFSVEEPARGALRLASCQLSVASSQGDEKTDTDLRINETNDPRDGGLGL